MPRHARQQIRDAVVDALKGLPTTAGRVYSGRTQPLADAHEPTLLVYTFEEQAVAATTGRPITLERALTLAVEGRVSLTNDVVPDDTLDDIALEVEGRLYADITVTGDVLDLQLVSTRIVTEAPGDRQLGEIRMEFRVLYRTAENAPGAFV